MLTYHKEIRMLVIIFTDILLGLIADSRTCMYYDKK